jgi:hypothetical protein
MKRHQNSASPNVKSDLTFVCLCGETFSEASNLQIHSKSCITLQHSHVNQTDDVDAQISILAQGGDSNSVLLIPPENSMSDGNMLQNSQTEVLIIKLDGSTLPENITNIPDIVTDDIQTIDDISIQQLNIVESDQINLADQSPIDIPLVNAAVDDVNIADKDGFLCGYCSTLFVELEEVQTHIVLEHGDQLPNEGDVQQNLHIDQQ